MDIFFKRARSLIENNWLTKTHLSINAREATATLFSYFLVVISILFSLSIAGIDVTNLALIAGALSVGIGFGLQNIVSNFISGLILLFERPIKRGDWIKVGGTEGIVKDINIRSTRIQTFDRSDILIPNSDLLTNHVTNLMLSDAIGRVRVCIGVAYGSDVEKVKQILLDIALAHPEVIRGQVHTPDPLPVFINFGDSSLNFELRAFIQDIYKIVPVTSDINCEIDKKFKESNITIPFPQRDVHVITGTDNVKNANADHSKKTDESEK